jgi:hypothetical protein
MWLHQWWQSRLVKLQNRRQKRALARTRRRALPMRVKQFEDRIVPTIFTIANGDVTGLSNAITTANSDGQADTIILASGGSYTLASVDNTTDGAPNALPVITSPSLTIEGGGSTIQPGTVTVVHQNYSTTTTLDTRLLDVAPGANLTVTGLTVTNFYVTEEAPNVRGGAIFNAGNLTLQHVVLEHGGVQWTNGTGGTAAGAGQNGGSVAGGAIFSSAGSLTVINSQITKNNAYAGTAAAGRRRPATAATPLAPPWPSAAGRPCSSTARSRPTASLLVARAGKRQRGPGRPRRHCGGRRPVRQRRSGRAF